MGNAFEIVTFAVTGAGIALSATSWFRPFRVLDDIGRFGKSWFDHAEDLPLDQRPDENERDAPIPLRPLRPGLF